jgi:hypothetical protein
VVCHPLASLADLDFLQAGLLVAHLVAHLVAGLVSLLVLLLASLVLWVEVDLRLEECHLVGCHPEECHLVECHLALEVAFLEVPLHPVLEVDPRHLEEAVPKLHKRSFAKEN